MGPDGRKGHGLIGYGIEMYNPLCAYSCRAVFSMSALNCSTMMGMEGMEGMADMAMAETSPECYATDDAFLQSMAYCISAKCTDLSKWKLEKYWKDNIVGTAPVQPDPKSTYQETLSNITSPPTEAMTSGDALNKTMLVDEEGYLQNWNAMGSFEKAEGIHEKYSIVIIMTCFILPIALSFLRFVPFPGWLVTRFNAWIIDPPLWGTKHKEPLAGGLGLMPTRGQSLFIAYILIINLILSAAGYSSAQPNAWTPDDTQSEIMTLVANRVGVISFANIPLLLLYSSRNNILFWVTDWSHSTFLLLHRWVAGVASIQAILHSILYLRLKLEAGTHAEESKLPYWYWGIIATLAMAILLPTSIMYFRQKAYELFLAWHVALSILTIVGCYYHILLRFAHQWGYESWIYTAMAVWGFDRIMRMLRMARNGLRTATITKIDDDYVRVDIPSVAATGHAYLYFPTLTWRVWENHPFSVASAVSPQSGARKPRSLGDEESAAAGKDEVKVSTASPSSTNGHTHVPAKLGLTFFLRGQGGLTRLLSSRSTLPVLVESSYGTHADTSDTPRLVCIIGGIGITAVLPYLHSHPGSSKLYWGVRSEGIVNAIDDEMLRSVDKEVFVGHRMNIREVLKEEIAYAGEGGVTVLVSGPDGMADEARVVVSEIGRKGKVNVRLVDEAFSW
ncbi:ferric reductase-like protein transmembrane component 4 [Lentithecium fluviatile CBS 122367]|uniref:Ferric reductase-like protein transmembrane component 4 n=1 Tax=Lentithecium fluviatile CBS 122367 TaxID=1168545 RepID=A0A6G1JB76_9PLEO|nr:ferric reductase-like protein transmembrane component 4 [Lentithecium fluviatile CBS 122367]